MLSLRSFAICDLKDVLHQLANRLRRRVLRSSLLRGKKPYRLDFALFVNDNKYDIEIDGDKAHSQKIESDILRDIHLRMDDWKVRRYQSSEIQYNMDYVVEEIHRYTIN